MKNLIIIIFFCIATMTMQSQIIFSEDAEDANWPTLVKDIRNLINQERLAYGLSTLSLVNVPEAEQNSRRIMAVDKKIKTYLVAEYLRSEDYKIRCASLRDSLARGLITKSEYKIVIDKQNILLPYTCVDSLKNRRAVENYLGARYVTVGEIAAVTSPGCQNPALTIFNKFKNCPKHYPIVLMPEATHATIGLAMGEDNTYYCTIFMILAK